MRASGVENRGNFVVFVVLFYSDTTTALLVLFHINSPCSPRAPPPTLPRCELCCCSFVRTLEGPILAARVLHGIGSTVVCSEA